MSKTRAQRGIKDFLSGFDDEDLFSLAGTVSQGLLKNKIDTRKEAIHAIIQYSSDEISILRRKIVTREHLFSYIHDNGLPVTLPITKNELVDIIIKSWEEPRHRSKRKSPDRISTSTPQQIEPAKATQLSSSSQTVATQESQPASNISALAEQFVTWFYSMLNRSDPLDSDHFFPDSKLKLNMYNLNHCESRETESPQEISQCLYQIKMQHQLYFNPNVSKEGIQGRMNPHGLVMVLACGTLHVNNVCAGVFEQVFALARDPSSDNNWKIKNTELNLRSKTGVLEAPSLGDSELTRGLLALPEQ